MFDFEKVLETMISALNRPVLYLRMFSHSNPRAWSNLKLVWSPEEKKVRDVGPQVHSCCIWSREDRLRPNKGERLQSGSQKKESRGERVRWNEGETGWGGKESMQPPQARNWYEIRCRYLPSDARGCWFEKRLFRAEGRVQRSICTSLIRIHLHVANYHWTRLVNVRHWLKQMIP